MENPLVKALKEVKYEPTGDLCGRVWQDVGARVARKARRKFFQYSLLAILAFALLTQTPKIGNVAASILASMFLLLVFLLCLKKAAKQIAK